MDSSQKKVSACRIKRAMRVRKSLRGCAAAPRFCVVKSNTHISAQLIDDEKHVTLASATTNAKELRGTEAGKKGRKGAELVGKSIAEQAQKLGVSKCIFDRGFNKYQANGLLATVANAAREGGLKF